MLLKSLLFIVAPHIQQRIKFIVPLVSLFGTGDFIDADFLYFMRGNLVSTSACSSRIFYDLMVAGFPEVVAKN